VHREDGELLTAQGTALGRGGTGLLLGSVLDVLPSRWLG
jgi:hypothetical protein